MKTKAPRRKSRYILFARALNFFCQLHVDHKKENVVVTELQFKTISIGWKTKISIFQIEKLPDDPAGTEDMLADFVDAEPDSE